MIAYPYLFDVPAFARDLLGFQPDDGQARLLATENQYVILNWHRQWGKSSAAAIRAVHRAAVAEAGESVPVVRGADGIRDQGRRDE